MDQDFYIEESSPIKVIFALIIFAGLIAGGIYFYLDYKNKDNIKLKSVTVELGEKLSTDIKYQRKDNKNILKIKKAIN